MAAPKNKKAFTPDPNAAKEHLAAAMEKLKNGLASVASSPAAFVQHLTFSARGNLHRYSFRNQILIQIQCPGAFHVGGYHYWIKKGRRPLAGQGCRILAPAIFKKMVEATAEEYEEIMGTPQEEGDPKLEIEKVYRRYKTVVVWDITRTTDAKGNAYDGPVPGTGGAAPVDFLTTDDEDEIAALVDDTLRSHLREQGVSVVTKCEGPEYGSYNHGKNQLCISPRFDPLTTCSTTVHEAAHREEFVQNLRGSYDLGELVAEGVAFIVLQHYGLDTSKFSFRYIRSYGGDLKQFQKGLAALQKIATTLVTVIDGKLSAEGAEETDEAA